MTVDLTDVRDVLCALNAGAHRESGELVEAEDAFTDAVQSHSAIKQLQRVRSANKALRSAGGEVVSYAAQLIGIELSEAGARCAELGEFYHGLHHFLTSDSGLRKLNSKGSFIEYTTPNEIFSSFVPTDSRGPCCTRG